MSDAPFTLRPATMADLPGINLIAEPQGMGGFPLDDVTVAVNSENQVVGFLRLQYDSGIWHVNPVATYPSWRGYGVGRALMEHALDRCGHIALVARGTSIPFYDALEYERVDWARIGAGVARECVGCPVLDQCHPQPMVKTADGFAGATDPDVPGAAPYGA